MGSIAGGQNLDKPRLNPCDSATPALGNEPARSPLKARPAPPNGSRIPGIYGEGDNFDSRLAHRGRATVRGQPGASFRRPEPDYDISGTRCVSAAPECRGPSNTPPSRRPKLLRQFVTAYGRGNATVMWCSSRNITKTYYCRRSGRGQPRCGRRGSSTMQRRKSN